MKNRNTVHVNKSKKNIAQNKPTCLNKESKSIKHAFIDFSSYYLGKGFVIVSQSKRATIKNSEMTIASMTQDWRPKFSQSLYNSMRY